MNVKQIVGLVILAAGVVLIIFSMQSFNRIGAEKGTYEGMGRLIPNEKAEGLFSGAVEKKAGEYHSQVTFLLVGGIVLAAVGAGVAYMYRKKRR
jgi:Na+/citrate or Na+/malate symporter